MGSGPGVHVTYTLDGATHTLSCPEGGEAPPHIGNFIAGVQLALACSSEHFAGATGLSAGVAFFDYTTLDGAFEYSEIGQAPNGDPVVREVDIAAKDIPDNVRSLTMRANGAKNLESYSISGTYDQGTRRIVGTFEAKWGPSNRPEIGEGEVRGTFDVTVPEVE